MGHFCHSMVESTGIKQNNSVCMLLPCPFFNNNGENTTDMPARKKRKNLYCQGGL